MTGQSCGAILNFSTTALIAAMSCSENRIAELQKVLKNPEVIEKLRGVGVTPASGEAQELAKFGPAELDKYGKLIKVANIKADCSFYANSTA